VLQQAALVAPLDVDVLITGPSGTGKTALARALHDNSARAGGPFVAVNCAALPDTLLESELFGAERGAHSTATRKVAGQGRGGRGRHAVPRRDRRPVAGAQAKLLHLLQAREYHALGATRSRAPTSGMIAATNAT
jgi:Nif-specific regulatory protein